MKPIDSVNYKPYSHSPKIITLSLKEAEKLYDENMADCLDYFLSLDIPRTQAERMADEIFWSHVVNF